MEKFNGFQLMELMVTLFIISLLIAISLPRYSHHLVQARRLEAENMLAKLALTIEQYYLSHHTYQGATIAALRFPEFVAKNNYQLKIELADDDTYLLMANPLGFQAEKDTLCGALTLHSSGEKNIRGLGKIEDCW